MRACVGAHAVSQRQGDAIVPTLMQDWFISTKFRMWHNGNNALRNYCLYPFVSIFLILIGDQRDRHHSAERKILTADLTGRGQVADCSFQTLRADYQPRYLNASLFPKLDD